MEKSDYSRKSYQVLSDSIEILSGTISPDFTKVYYDTVLEPVNYDCDFIVVEYNFGKSNLQLVDCDDLFCNETSFERSLFRKGDWMNITVGNKNDPFGEYYITVR